MNSEDKPPITVDVVVNTVYISCPDCGRRLKVVVSTSKKEICDHLWKMYSISDNSNEVKCAKCGTAYVR